MRSQFLLALSSGLLFTVVGCGTARHDESSGSRDASAKSAGVADRRAVAKHEAPPESGSRTETSSKSTTPVPNRRGKTLARFAEPRMKPEPALGKDFKPEQRIPKLQPQPVARQKTRLQSGTLTAGSLDDHAGYDEFRDFYSTMLQQPGNRNLPKVRIGKRVEIAVVNDQGEPVGHARVAIRGADNTGNGSVAEFPTGTDGRAVFLPGYEGGERSEAFRVTVTSLDGKRTVTEVREFGGAPWTFTLPKAEAKLPTRLDLALVVDTTGSMQDELEYLKAEIASIASAVHDLYPSVDQRYALILYRDHGDHYVTRTIDFTGSIDEFRKSLSQQSADGGGDFPEAVHLALEQSLKLSWRGGNTARAMFLIGDAPPHPQDEQQSLESIRNLRKRGVTIFPVAASGAKKRAEFLFRIAAFVTRGQYLFLTDHSGVGNSHAKPHASKYNVERLDQLMIRMIASQLAGKSLLPRDIIANERTGNDPVRAQRPRQRRSSSPPKQQPPMLPATPMSYHSSTDQHQTAGLWTQSSRWFIGVIAILGIVFLERLRK